MALAGLLAAALTLGVVGCVVLTALAAGWLLRRAEPLWERRRPRPAEPPPVVAVRRASELDEPRGEA